MKKLLVIITILLIASSPVWAFSIRDILNDFRGIFLNDKITGTAVTCTNGQLKCGTSTECSGSICVMQCQSSKWVKYQYCSYQCSNGQCTTSTGTSTGISGTTSGTGTTDTSSTGTSTGISGTTNTSSTSSTGTTSTGTTEPTPPTAPVTEPTTPITPQTCSDGTLSAQCSTNKPYFCDNGNLIQNCNTCGCPTEKECINNQCVDKEPYDPGGVEDNDPDVLNMPPLITPIPQKIIKIGESIQFEVNAIDPNNDQIRYSIQPPEVTTCSISSNIVSCTGIKAGDGTLTITANDGKDQAVRDVFLKVLGELPKLQKGVAAGIANTPPTADAGPDKIGIPGAEVTFDASLSYDKEGLLSVPETYKWYENNNPIGTGKIIKKIFPLGSHEIKLIVTDSEGLTSEDTLKLTVKEKNVCKNTQTIYYPEDTLCNSKWPIKEGDTFKINSVTEGSCSLFEVCSDDIDYIIDDSIQCCTSELTDPEKAPACNFATENSQTLKNCQALYIINSLGRAAIYMQGYFDAEMCCKGVEALCPQQSYLYTSQPLPEYLKGVKCSNTPENNPNGYWASDTKLNLNEIALFDAPAHSSLNVLKMGTCVDYSTAATTLLRKIGFSSESILTTEASNHAYNLIRFDLDKKYTIFDTTGNNDGLRLGKVPPGYDYCENIINCYNDLGKIPCPSNKEINGCENIKENIGRTTGTVGYKITNTFKELYDKFKTEVLR